MNKHDRRINYGPFKPENSDGCTLVSWAWRLLTRKELPFVQCCIDHDKAYWYGGTKQERWDADNNLRKCILGHASDNIFSKLLYVGVSSVMWVFVRIFGSPKLPFPWRWKFSQPYATRDAFGGYDKD